MLRSSARLERQVLRSAAIRASKRSLNTQPRRVHGSNAFIAVPVVSLAVIYLAWPVAAAESPQSGPSGQRTDSSSGVSFPSQIKPENAGSPLELVGLGVRTVTLFGIQVYTVGLYASQGTLRCLHRVPGWANMSVQALTDKPTGDERPMDALMQNLYQFPVELCIRIVPTRGTDFGHLRDGLVRALVARKKLRGDQEEIGPALDEFKGFFPTGKMAKGDVLVLVRTEDGSLAVEYKDKTLGVLRSKFIADELIQAYLADKDPISPKAKLDILQGFSEVLDIARKPATA